MTLRYIMIVSEVELLRAVAFHPSALYYFLYMPKLSKKRREEIMKQFGGRMPTKEEIFEKIRASQERLMEFLAGAAKTAPEDPQIRKQLLEVIEKAGNLRKSVYKNVLKTKPPKIREESEKAN